MNTTTLPNTSMKDLETAEFLGVDSSNEEAYRAEPFFRVLGHGGGGWMTLASAIWYSIANDMLGAKAEVLRSDEEVLSNNQTTFDIRFGVRVSKGPKNNYTVWLPIQHQGIRPYSMFGRVEWDSCNPDALLPKIDQVLPGLLNIEAPVDRILSMPDINLSDEQLGFPEASIDDIKKVVRRVRVTSRPLTRASLVPSLLTNSELDSFMDGSADRYVKRKVLRVLLEKRACTVFIELLVSEAAATHICQGPPQMNLLAGYFVLAQETDWLWGSGTRWMHHVQPISNIAKANSESSMPTMPRTDDHGLTVDGSGVLMWVPTTDNTQFVEAEIEQGGLQPNGEWTPHDMIDPERNEYIQVPGPNGRLVRRRRPRGNNRLLYTDWHLSLMSFTDDNGMVELLDMSMFRKANPGQLANILKMDLNNERVIEYLHYSVQRASENGVSVTNDASWYAPYLSEQQGAELTSILNSGDLRGWLRELRAKLVAANVSRQGAAGPLTPDQHDRLESMMGSFTIDNVSPNSPVQFLRALGAFLRKQYEWVNANQNDLFGRYAVLTTLREMATLTVIANYAGQHQALADLARVEADKCEHPNVQPIADVEIKDIPYVSGSVELFPHQVKAWNYISTNPENLVLDVSAGGGKTFLALLDIAFHLKKGMRWPLVACPENLIKNYIADAAFLFKGRMNMVVVNNTSFNSPEWGEDRLMELIQSAPVNTIFLTDFNFMIPRRGSKRMRRVVYGTQTLEISLNTEFLKRVPWGGIWIDESHLTKNPSGSINKELMRLTAPIKVRRQLSGTYISDNLTDVVGQFAMLNPQAFGTMQDFVSEYYTGGKSSAPLPGSQQLIRNRMSKSALVVTIRRKEWAALLPRRSDSFWAVEMTSNQRKVYQRILVQQRQDLIERMKEDPELAGLLENGARQADDPNEDRDAALDRLLGFYLQRLEQFVTAPGSDPLGSSLQGEDAVSPKLGKLVEILRNHVKNKIKGKVLIWTQYVESAASIFRSLPPDLASACVHYTAANEDSCVSEFRSNPKKLFLVGCEKSMNTGHNYQFCSRTVRLETVWNWGTLEQGEARTNRPTLDDPRRHENGGQGIFYDWIFCNKSMDVTKNARMLSKMIATIKFYETGRAYAQLPDLPLVKLSQDNIFEMNDWRDGEKGCLAYFEAYQEYAAIEQEEFDKYLKDPSNRLEPYTLEEGEILPGSGILKNIPYIPQMRLFGAEQLGLVPLIEYMQSTTVKKGKKTLTLAEDPDWDPAGLKVHTEFGDCVASGFNRSSGAAKTIRVVTPSGKTESVPTTMVWVITKESASGEDVRSRIAKQIGVKTMKVVVPQVPETPKQLKKLKVVPPKETEVVPDADGGFPVWCETYNHFLSLVVNDIDEDVKAAMPQLKKLGFFEVPDYYYTKVANARVLSRWIDAVSAKLEIHPVFLKSLQEDAARWAKTGKTMEQFAMGLAAAGRKTFLREQVKPAPKGVIKPYLIAHEGRVFLCLNQLVNAASLTKVRNLAVSGVKWNLVSSELWAFFASKTEAQSVIKELFNKFNITNRKELLEGFAKARVIKVVKME